MPSTSLPSTLLYQEVFDVLRDLKTREECKIYHRLKGCRWEKESIANLACFCDSGDYAGRTTPVRSISPERAQVSLFFTLLKTLEKE
ncbi:hypothetical protein JTE90_011535 [Oedothorax gibbosus]|uniref:Uncharacterized protein n=1 Tax=Oedothorax gibbosus TaxID=931172 RepID=A0AAV6UIS0_9ARAC|nr:hypothetical protein JTE90_011535 [Oedothorax gibbosus]